MKPARGQFINFAYPSSLLIPTHVRWPTLSQILFSYSPKNNSGLLLLSDFHPSHEMHPLLFHRRGDIIATPIRQSTNVLQVSWFISWSLTQMEIILIHIRWRPCLGPFAITICDVLSLGSLRYSTRAGFRTESMAPDPSQLPWALSPLFCWKRYLFIDGTLLYSNNAVYNLMIAPFSRAAVSDEIQSQSYWVDLTKLFLWTHLSPSFPRSEKEGIILPQRLIRITRNGCSSLPHSTFSVIFHSSHYRFISWIYHVAAWSNVYDCLSFLNNSITKRFPFEFRLSI